MAKTVDMAKFAAFCKDTGFIFQSSEIYGGINGFWDFGPLGVELKKNIKDAWWQDMVRNPPPGPDGQEIRMVGLDCSIIMNPKVWVASGHVGGFSDPMVDCKESKKRYRADQLIIHMISPTTDTISQEKIEASMRYFAFIKGDEASANLANKKATKYWKGIAPKADMLPTNVTSMDKLSPMKFSIVVGPDVELPGTLTEPRAFNLMFESHAGPIASDENKVYLRPETAQGIFANFKNVLDSSRLKVPFGVAQIGKAFRNEINPRNFIFRSREFEQMEIEFFCHPDESMKWYEYWRDLRKRWYSTLGIQSSNLVPREQGKEELAHYSIGTTDIEYLFPFSDEPQELEGVAHRGAFDITAHATHSGLGEKLKYFDQDRWQADAANRTTNSFEQWVKTTNPTPEQIEKYKFFPHVIEPSAGADRFALAVLMEAYTIDQAPTKDGKIEERTVMKLHPRLAPIKAAVFPLEGRNGMPEKALALYRELKRDMNAVYDASGAIGRRYRRQDEVGTPFCITIDQDTLVDDTVTIRDRDTLQQQRVKIGDVKSIIMKALRA
jgi:glycyl-tRNA synthetase